MNLGPYTQEEKREELAKLMREAAVEARAERFGDSLYTQRVKNPFAGGKFDGFDKPQNDWRKALSEAILYTDAAELLDGFEGVAK